MGGGTKLACCAPPGGGVGWAFNDLVHLKQRETVLQVQMCFSDVQGVMPGSWGGQGVGSR